LKTLEGKANNIDLIFQKLDTAYMIIENNPYGKVKVIYDDIVLNFKDLKRLISLLRVLNLFVQGIDHLKSIKDDEREIKGDVLAIENGLQVIKDLSSKLEEKENHLVLLKRYLVSCKTKNEFVSDREKALMKYIGLLKESKTCPFCLSKITSEQIKVILSGMVCDG